MNFIRLILMLLSLSFLMMTVVAQDRAALAREYIPKLEKNLTENIAPFWLSKSIDRQHGGYVINFDIHGQPNGNSSKMIVSQARTVWLFSRMARAGYKRSEFLEAAEHGFRFLGEKMWDNRHGGFYWEVDESGKPLKPKKHLYGQSFALYALSEYYLASQKKEALELATRFFYLLEARAYDQKFGGYLEYFNEDWSVPEANENGYMGVPHSLKLMNTHLHLLEALTTFYRASKLPLARERLLELISIESNSVIRKQLTACTDKYDRNWTPRLDGEWARVSYGHDLENIWLLMDACDAAGISTHPFTDLYRALFEYSLKYGYDTSRGGFYDSGRFNQPADRLNKIWWVEAEAIVSALYLYRLTGEAKYLDVFKKTYEFIEKYQTDWQRGEWYATITPAGQAQGDKAQPWKAGYHNGRAMIECLELLKQISQ
jgi:mannobiose 2-epimerase